MSFRQRELGLRSASRLRDARSACAAMGPMASTTRRWARARRAPAQLSERLMAPLVALNGVAKRFDRRRPAVLSDLELAVGAGEVVSVSGRNGAGKTTLLRVVAGLVLPDAGTVRVAGLDPERDRRDYQRQVGLLAAGSSGLYGRLAVEHHLDFWASIALLPRRRRTEAIARVSESFALGDLMGRRVDRLSMGQRQRLRLALTFVHDPALALLDEPSTSLDADGLALLDAELGLLRARGGAAIVCAPSGDHEGLAIDRRLAMSDGRLLAA